MRIGIQKRYLNYFFFFHYPVNVKCFDKIGKYQNAN